MNQQGISDDYPVRDDDGLAPYGGATAIGAPRDDADADLDDHDAVGLCGEDYIGGCFV